jgi:transposase
LNQFRQPPDHSTISRTRRLIDVETHEAVFRWVLELLAEKGLRKGKTVGVDATTLEANAAMRSIVRRDTGEGHEEFLRRLAEESGIATPTREQLAKLDRERKKTASNEDWANPLPLVSHLPAYSVFQILAILIPRHL